MVDSDHLVVVVNFTDVYKNESFYRHTDYTWIDCTDIQETKYYCSDEAVSSIEKRIQPFSPYGIHFIDSGNYHYMSKLWTDKIREPFSLIVFDHHPDMQPSLFANILSCGCWVKEILDTNPFIRKVIIIGAADVLLRQAGIVAGKGADKRVIAFSERALHQRSSWRMFSSLHLNEPVYISIDKDVLEGEAAVTDWDNGSMTLAELKALLDQILREDKVLGIDICGDCSDTLRTITDRSIIHVNDECNKELLHQLYYALNNFCNFAPICPKQKAK